VEIAGSAHKHGVTDEDIRHALNNAIKYHDLDDLVMIVGPTTTGDLIEVGMATEPADAEPLIVHAMPARPKFL
jgi:hypothetical protein